MTERDRSDFRLNANCTSWIIRSPAIRNPKKDSRNLGWVQTLVAVILFWDQGGLDVGQILS